MEKRVLLAVVLSFLVLYGFQAMFPPPEPPKPGTSPAPAAAPPQSGRAGEPAAQAPAAAPAATAAQPAATPLEADEAERDIVVESEWVKATFTTRGGALKSWRLKKYLDHGGQPLELVPQDVPAGSNRPFTLSVDDSAVSSTLARALFRPSAPSVSVTRGTEKLAFDYSDASGVTAHKEFVFDPAFPYIVTVTAQVSNGGAPVQPTIQWGPALGTALDASSAGYYNQPPRAIVHQAGEEERFDPSDLNEIANAQGVYDFVGVDDHYFMAAAVKLGHPVQVHYESLQLPLREGTDKPPPPYVSWSVRLSGAPQPIAFFAGPKDYDLLRAISPDLTRAIDFGMFSPLVVPLLRSLKWVNGYVGNYGWSIVLLTVLINVAMFPLRHKSVVSMRRMQEIQPEIKAIQDRYAKLKITDPARQKMNEEMMALYKTRGVNPASGCVPMLLTLPVLFAFYALLSVAIELRGAPFFGWIKDLSLHDPLYITPVLMGLTQFVQTKMTPTTADPTQQRIMLLMPLMFMGMFLWAPSGLVVYWTISNMWAIGQQAITNKLIGPPQQRTVRPAAERRVKAVGTGRSEQAAKERQ